MPQREESTPTPPSTCMRLCGRKDPDIMCLVVQTCPIAVSAAARSATGDHLRTIVAEIRAGDHAPK